MVIKLFELIEFFELFFEIKTLEIPIELAPIISATGLSPKWIEFPGGIPNLSKV